MALGFSSALASNLEEVDEMVEVGVKEPCEGDPGADAPDAAQLGAGAFLDFEASSDELLERWSGDIVEKRESESSVIPKLELALLGNNSCEFSMLMYDGKESVWLMNVR